MCEYSKGFAGFAKKSATSLYPVNGFLVETDCVYLSKQGPVLVMLLCGGDKSDQIRDIERAIAYLKDWKQRGSREPIAD